MAYKNFTNCTEEEYLDIIYSQDDTNRIRIWFNNVELEDADEYCISLTASNRILPNDGSQRFSLSNFIAKELDLILRDLPENTVIENQVKISIGTVVDIEYIATTDETYLPEKSYYSYNNSTYTLLEVGTDYEIGDTISGTKYETSDIYEDVPIGIFNIQDDPITDQNKVTIKLRDNRVKFDFKYNSEELIEKQYIITEDETYQEDKNYYSYSNNEYTLLIAGTDYQIDAAITGTVYEKKGSVTLKQILEDICTQANVESDIETFQGEDIEVGIYDNTINATNYVAYIAEQAGAIPVITREGHLNFVYLKELQHWQIPLSVVEKYEIGTPFGIDRVVYESGVIKYETSDNEDLDTLYLNSANPYINTQEQVDNINNKLNGFKTDSITTGKILGNPAIDPQDIIEIYDDEVADSPITTETGTDITIEDTIEDKLEIELKPSQITQAILPSEYTQVEYIESNGNTTTHINTGFKPNNNTKIEVVASITETSSSGKFIFGTRNSARTDIFCGLIWTSNHPAAGYGSSGLYQENNITTTEDTIFKITLDKNLFYYNDTLIKTFDTYTFTSENNLFLFSANTAGSTDSQRFKGKMYSCKIYDNDILIRDYIPCYRNSDNVIGLYDLINYQFYSNNGGGAFSKGSNSTPTPSSPQDIHTTNKENKIQIYSYNVFDGEIELGNISPSDGSLSPSTVRTRSKNFIKVKPNTTYTFTRTQTGGYRWFIGYKKNKTGITDGISGWPSALQNMDTNQTVKTFTTSPTTEYLKWYDTNSTNLTEQVMINEGNETISFKPYAKKYSVNLKSKNICDLAWLIPQFVSYSVVENGYTFLPSGNIYSDGVSLDIPISLPISIKYKIKNGTGTNFRLRMWFDNGTAQSFNSYGSGTGTEEQTITINNYTKTGATKITKIGGDFTNQGTFTITEFMLNEGTTVLPYEPYYDYGEYCKFNDTYKNKFIVNSGKNIVDLKTWLTSYNVSFTENADGSLTFTPSQSLNTTPLVFSNTNINVSMSGIFKNGTSVNARIQLLDNTNTSLGAINDSTQKLENKNGCKLRFNWGTSGTMTVQNFMLNLGTTALEYEPYGSNEWYIKKNIEKKVFIGASSEGWRMPNTNSNNAVFCNYTNTVIYDFRNSTDPQYSNYFKWKGEGYGYQDALNKGVGMYTYTQQNNKYVYYVIPLTEANTVEKWYQWLSSHNLEMYYIMATPTYTRITGTLREQLEEIYQNLKSLKGQTNISQENSDLPFEITASAYNNSLISKSLANNSYTYNGVHRQTFDTQIGKEQRKENVSLNSETTFRKYAKTSIDNLNGSITLVAGEQDDLENRVSQTEFNISKEAARIDVLSTNIDEETGDVLALKRTNYEFGSNGIIIESENYKSIKNTTGDYYYDNGVMIGKYTKDGSVQKDIALFGKYYYGIDENLDVENFSKNDAMFVAQLYEDGNNETGFGHFYNGS